jgi:sialate O-acetylesterase
MKHPQGSTTLIFHLSKITFFIILLASCAVTQAQVRLPRVFGSNMVLQRGVAIPVWGTAKSGSQITVELAGKRVKTKAASTGKWSLSLPAIPAGGPYVLLVYEGVAPKPTVKFDNVLIGDVWVASGQSNMEWQVQQSANADMEIKNAKYPQIRFFNVPHNKQVRPQDTLSGGSWVAADSSGVKTASAVAYFFARDLHKELNVPIGILQSTWGGTPVEAWTSREQLSSSKITHDRVLQNDTVKQAYFVRDSVDLLRFWDIVYHPQHKTDLEVPKTNYNDANWTQVNMPVTLKGMNIPAYEGMVWLRKTISIPASMLGKDLTLNLGHPEMNYSLYFNGEEIAKTVWNASPTHHYTIPAKLVKADNVISVRMAFLWSGGGFNPPAEDMYITDGAARLNIAGTWKYKKDLEPALPKIKNYHQYPTFLYNGMIHPILTYGVKGFIWYQGEDNAAKPGEYRSLFPLMIADWRSRWKQGNLPFLYVQLASYMKREPEPSESDWAELREAQTMTLSQPNTSMATIIDIGEAENIHPKNKQEVGRRLALLAKKLVYKKQVQAYGPMYESHKVEGDQVRIRFSEIGGGLAQKGSGELKGFAVAGSDNKFYWATAKIDGSSVVIHSDKVKTPVAVRYAWADNPECNLINKEGLPAVPFRTDGTMN